MEKENEQNIPYVDIFNYLKNWYDQAKEAYDAKEISNYNAATLATCNKNIPNVRIVLVKDLTIDGFIFYTNYNSIKSQEISANGNVSLLFYWEILHRQLKVQGSIIKSSVEASKEYFFSRPKESQIAAWSSFQSSKLSHYDILLDRFNNLSNQYKADVPYLSNWGGYILKPTYIEFWEEGQHRLHKRQIFEQEDNNRWCQYYLNP